MVSDSVTMEPIRRADALMPPPPPPTPPTPLLLLCRCRVGGEVIRVNARSETVTIKLDDGKGTTLVRESWVSKTVRFDGAMPCIACSILSSPMHACVPVV
jgi:hypothetical protein